MQNRRLPPLASIYALRPYAPIYCLALLIPALNRRVMTRDDDSFRIRPGKVRDRGAPRSPRIVRPRPKTFLAEVHQAIRRAGGNPNQLAGTGKASGRFNARGRGAQIAAGLKGRNGWSRDGSGVRTRSRRVAVKARIVKLNPQRGATRGRQFVSGKGPRVETLTDLPLNEQVRHEGATWLDRTMIGGGRDTMPHGGFGSDVRAAWEVRNDR